MNPVGIWAVERAKYIIYCLGQCYILRGGKPRKRYDLSSCVPSTFDIGIDIRSYRAIKIAFDFSRSRVRVSVVRGYEISRKDYSGNRGYILAGDTFSELLLDTLWTISAAIHRYVVRYSPLSARSEFLRAVLRSRGNKDADSGRNANFRCTFCTAPAAAAARACNGVCNVVRPSYRCRVSNTRFVRRGNFPWINCILL